MDATTTHSMSLLIQTLKNAYPDLTFSEAEQFSWSPSKKTVFYNPTLPHATSLLLHELSHALLEHRNYQRDIELIAMETAAWEKAQLLANEYVAILNDPSLDISEDAIQDHLDTYRDWLHARSTCPQCSATGFQTGKSTYACPACSHTWRVNEARLCALRRYSTS